MRARDSFFRSPFVCLWCLVFSFCFIISTPDKLYGSVIDCVYKELANVQMIVAAVSDKTKSNIWSNV
ncbi:hypothetical protein GWI33_005045 [Rhynchophorus ferrugineus]|uniref:Secreted protein n=1 Tax=Rhynchophorus ferrugineus TaxID=354439 RepID=A0A834MEY1_RHYFE|nr:hypothetical protein GWI33_005045 [Rhynchophorus ferrugineus]